MSSDFLSGGVVVTTHGLHEPTRVYRATGRPATLQPLVVLVNKWSASASEITAGALQDHHRATIIGTRTYGKAVAQTNFALPGGATLHMTIAGYLTPNGRDINHKGITPSVTVVDNPRRPVTRRWTGRCSTLSAVTRQSGEQAAPAGAGGAGAAAPRGAAPAGLAGRREPPARAAAGHARRPRGALGQVLVARAAVRRRARLSGGARRSRPPRRRRRAGRAGQAQPHDDRRGAGHRPRPAGRAQGARGLAGREPRVPRRCARRSRRASPGAARRRPDDPRRDLADLPTFTIDPDSARDFDDAISVRAEGAGYRAWVHIADVSFYVAPDGPIDTEARRRTASLYLPLWAEPMLPSELSRACAAWSRASRARPSPSSSPSTPRAGARRWPSTARLS